MSRMNLSGGPVTASLHTADGTAFSGAGRLVAFCEVSSALAGNIKFRDGGAAGTIICELDTNPGAQQTHHNVGGDGIHFGTDLYVDIDANVTSVTVFFIKAPRT